MGLRVDNGVLSAYVPLCPGERVESAEIERPLAADDREVLWRGEAPRSPSAKIVTVDSSGWDRTEGGFTYLGQDFALNIDSTQLAYGLTIDDGKTVPDDLPPGTFDDNGRPVTASDLDAASPC